MQIPDPDSISIVRYIQLLEEVSDSLELEDKKSKWIAFSKDGKEVRVFDSVKEAKAFGFTKASQKNLSEFSMKLLQAQKHLSKESMKLQEVMQTIERKAAVVLQRGFRKREFRKNVKSSLGSEKRWLKRL